MASENEPNKNAELKWVQIPQQNVLSFSEKLELKFNENPFVFGGTLATITALSLGLMNFYKADGKKQQRMMRFRVLAQGFTIAAVGVGLVFAQLSEKKEKKTS